MGMSLKASIPVGKKTELVCGTGEIRALFDLSVGSKDHIEVKPLLFLRDILDFDLMAAKVFSEHIGPFIVRDSGHFLQWEAAHVLNQSVKYFCGA